MKQLSTILSILSLLLIAVLFFLFKELMSQAKAKENSMNAELSGMEKNYQKKIAEWQKKGAAMTQAESEQAQQ